MLRAVSTRRGRGYERIGDESRISLLDAKLERAKSVPAGKVFGATVAELGLTSKFPADKSSNSKQKKNKNKAGNTITHPIFSLFYDRKKRKTTAKPEFARYIQYLKEGGMWDFKSNMPVLYYK